jgi:8-oxo-dGTP diphosphatase
MKYVVGLLHDGKNIVLVKKDRPDYLKGKFNGPGGKIEKGETPAQAIEREYFEETGLRITNWRPFAGMTFGQTWEHNIFFFEKKVPTAVLRRAKTMESEPVSVKKISTLSKKKCASNLLWAVHLGTSKHKFAFANLTELT